MSFESGIDFHDEDDEIKDYINNQKAKSKRNKDKTDLNTFNKFRNANGYRSVVIEKLSEKELNNILYQFFMKVLTRKGKLYEPDTLTGIRNSLQRVLNERGSKHDLRGGLGFVKSRDVLAARRKELTKN